MYPHATSLDPAGAYCGVSDRSMNARLGSTEFRHTFTESARVYALSLEESMPPPEAAVMNSMGIDLEAWSAPPLPEEWEAFEEEPGGEPTEQEMSHDEIPGVVIDLEGLNDRIHPVTDVTPGTGSTQGQVGSTRSRPSVRSCTSTAWRTCRHRC